MSTTTRLPRTQLLVAFAASTLAASKPGEEQPGEGGEAPASAGVLLALLATVVAFVLCIIG